MGSRTDAIDSLNVIGQLDVVEGAVPGLHYNPQLARGRNGEHVDRRVETFLQVAENGSFSETARKLFISQPAVTQQIASLGDELGVRLFERDGNRMMLTTPGRVAQAHYQRIFNEEQALKRELAPWSARRSFTIGCPSGMIEYDEARYSRVLHIAMKCFPDADVCSIKLSNPSQHFRVLANHEADVIVSGVESTQEEHGDAIEYRILRAIRHYVVCRRDDPLAKQPLVEIGQLAGRVVYTFDSEAFPNKLLQVLTKSNGPQPALRHQQSLAGVLPLIQAGRGITIYAQVIPLPQDLVLVPLNFAPNAHVGLIWLRGSQPQGRAFNSFVDQVAQVFLPERKEEKALRRKQAKQARANVSEEERARQREAVCERLLGLPEVGTARVAACYLAHGDELDLGRFMQAFVANENGPDGTTDATTDTDSAAQTSGGLGTQHGSGEYESLNGHRKILATSEVVLHAGPETVSISQSPARIVALPITLRGPRLAFVRVDVAELANLETLPHCLREPSRPLEAVPAELAHRVIDPADIDVAILPGLAFDTHGTRLGYGGGYYDAWLGEVYCPGDTGKSGKRSGSARRSTSKAPSPHRPFLIGACFDCQLLPPAATLPREPRDIAMDAVVTAGEVVRA